MNRFYLLGALIAGFVLPFVQLAMQDTQINMQVIQLPVVNISSGFVTMPEADMNIGKNNIMNWLSIIYVVGMVLTVLRFLRDLVGVNWMIRSAKVEKIDGITVVHVAQDSAPFSFFNYLFVFDIEQFSQEEWSQILRHEKTHINQFHSLDIIFTEVIKILFWWNPIIYMYQGALREVHEYEADFRVKKETNIKQYGLLLMKQSLSKHRVAATNSFINSHLKKRVMMMTKKRSKPLTKLRYVGSLPLLLLMVFISFGNKAIAQTEQVKIAEESIDTIIVIDPVTFTESLEIVKGVTYENHDLDQIAILEDCAGHGDLKEQKLCSDNQLFTTLINNVQYPKEAREAGMEGMVLIKIFVGGDGFSRYEILKDPGFGMGSEVVRTLLDASFKWRPAMLDGKKVSVVYVQPIKFKLSKDKEIEAHDDKKEQSAFSNVKAIYDEGKIIIDFDYADGTDEWIDLQIYDQNGRFLSASGGTKHHFEKTIKGSDVSIIIVAMKDDHGNKVIRKIAKLD